MINTEINYTTILKNKRLILIAGDESKDFLNNLLTNDLSSLDKKDSIYSCLLTPQGKINSHFFITKKNNEYLIIIDVPSGSATGPSGKASSVEINSPSSFIIFTSTSYGLSSSSLAARGKFPATTSITAGKYRPANPACSVAL